MRLRRIAQPAHTGHTGRFYTLESRGSQSPIKSFLPFKLCCTRGPHRGSARLAALAMRRVRHALVRTPAARGGGDWLTA